MSPEDQHGDITKSSSPVHSWYNILMNRENLRKITLLGLTIALCLMLCLILVLELKSKKNQEGGPSLITHPTEKVGWDQITLQYYVWYDKGADKLVLQAISDDPEEVAGASREFSAKYLEEITGKSDFFEVIEARSTSNQNLAIAISLWFRETSPDGGSTGNCLWVLYTYPRDTLDDLKISHCSDVSKGDSDLNETIQKLSPQ